MPRDAAYDIIVSTAQRMSRSKLVALFVCLNLAVIPIYAREPPPQGKPAWLSLTQAYSSGKNAIVTGYTHSDKQYLRLYAVALRDLSNRDPRAIARDGDACYRAKPRSAPAATAYFYCLSAVSAEFFQNSFTKDGYIWQSKLISFYKKYASDIDKETGSNNPSGVKDLGIPSLHIIRTWPDQIISKQKKWKSIKLENGIATAYINHKPILVRADTGSTAIFLSRSDVEKLKLEDDLVPLSKTVAFAENASSFFNGGLYYVKTFVLGPVHIDNAYIVVYNGNVSIVGMSILEPLKKFSISSSRISDFRLSSADVCSPMIYSRSGRSGSFPFSYVRTNFGRMGLMLDNGLIGHGPFVNAEVALAPAQVALLKDHLNDGNATVVNASIAEGGKYVPFKTVMFRIKINGRSASAYFNHEDYYDKRVDGKLTFDFLKHAVVSYDFPDRKMCIRRIR